MVCYTICCSSWDVIIHLDVRVVIDITIFFWVCNNQEIKQQKTRLRVGRSSYHPTGIFAPFGANFSIFLEIKNDLKIYAQFHKQDLWTFC